MIDKRNHHRQWQLSRRQFLNAIGAGAAAVGAGGVGISAGQAAGSFGRMFDLPPFALESPAVTAALLELGKRGGILDANDNLAAGPIALITNPALNVNNPNNENHTAGTTFMGQFLDHDMTFDTMSQLGKATDPLTLNARRPAFDLDSVYGDGPVGSPQLYGRSGRDRIKFRVENGGMFEDLPRDRSNVAIIADPRNDEHLILAGLHAAFLLFHNKCVDLVRDENRRISNENAFRMARRLVTWHYQWMILHEFLPLFIGQEMVDDILDGRRFYNLENGEAFIPVEFQIGYRFGHSMIRPSYRANFTGDEQGPGGQFFAMIFGPEGELNPDDPDDLRGGARAPRRFIGWTTFFRFPDFPNDVRPNKLIDTRLSTPLFNLPLAAIPAGSPPTSLPQRNLLRHLTWQLPSGQAIADAMGAPVLSPADLSELRPIRASFATSTPLWYYILKEAQLMEKGLRLGPVGGRIVGEVFIGLLQTDPNSYVNVQPDFTPTLGSISPSGDFRMIDFLTFAGVADKR